MRSQWDDLCTHDASTHIREADQVIVAMVSMGESVLDHVLAQ
jgi:hypothetical protein